MDVTHSRLSVKVKRLKTSAVEELKAKGCILSTEETSEYCVDALGSTRRKRKKEKASHFEQQSGKMTSVTAPARQKESPKKSKKDVFTKHQLLEAFRALPRIQHLRALLWNTNFWPPSPEFRNKEAACSEGKELPPKLAKMFDCCMDENTLGNALAVLFGLQSTKWFPPARAVTAILSVILEPEENKELEDKAELLLLDLRHSHPPVIQPVSDMYFQALFCQKKNDNEPARALFDIIRLSLQQIERFQFLLNFYIEILEINFCDFLSKTTDPSIQFNNRQIAPLVVRVFWQDSKVGSLNKNCNDLFLFLAQALKEEDFYGTLTKLQQLVNMVAECIRLSKVSSNDQGVTSMNSYSCRQLATEIVYTCAETLENKCLVKRLLSTLEPTWLRIHVSEMLLLKVNSFRTPKDGLSLKSILTIYMNPGFVQSPRKGLESSDKANSQISRNQSAKDLAVAHAKNRKGETALHLACVENNINELQRLLSIPGVNPSAKDNAGWTPLHEACNFGHLECTQALLQWIPHPHFAPIDSDIFVDIASQNVDGITPLHDAIMNNHLNVAKLLVSYGGRALLDIKDKKGVTPLDHASNQEVFNTLTSPSKMKKISKTKKKSQKEWSADDIINSVKFSHNHCIEFLDCLGFLAGSYLTWNRLRELHEIAQQLKKTEIGTDLLLEVYESVFGIQPSKAELKRLCSDLNHIPKVSKQLQNLDSLVEKLTGENKELFETELFELSFKIGCFNKND